MAENKTTRLDIASFGIVSAYEAIVEDAEALNYVVIYLPKDSEYFQWKHKSERAFADIIKVERAERRGIVDVTLHVEQAGRNRNFLLSLPYGWFQSAHMFSFNQNTSPLFLVAEEGSFQEHEIYEFESFDFVVNGIDPDSELNMRIHTVFQEISVNHAIYQMSQKDYDKVRGDVLSTVLALMQGDLRALRRIQRTENLLDETKQKLEDRYYAPTSPEKQAFFTRQHIYRLVTATHPSRFVLKPGSQEELMQQHETISEFEQIMAQNNMEETFAALTSTPVSTPDSNSDDDAKMAYFSSTTTDLPASMLPLLSGLLSNPHFERNWNTEGPDRQINQLIPNGESMTAAFVTVAVRLARLKEIADTPEENFHPTLVMQNFLTHENEPIIWLYQQVHRLLGTGYEYPFEDFFLSQLPVEMPDEIPEEMIVATPAGNAFHNLGHLMLNEEYGLQALRPAFEKLPIIASFMEDCFEGDARARSSHDQGFDHAEGYCPVIEATFKTLHVRFNRKDIIHQLGQAYIIFAELNALKNTEYQQGTREWKSYLQDFLYNVSE